MAAQPPAFLGTPIRVRMRRARALSFMASLFSAAPDSGGVGNFRLLSQEEVNWCWAAIVQSYRPHLSQEAIATAHVQASGRPIVCTGANRSKTDQADCAVRACQTACNGLHSLTAVFTEIGLLRSVWTGSQRLSFEDVVTEVGRQRAVPCRLSWGHLISIHGWRRDGSGGKFVSVSDPLSEGAPEPPRPVRVKEYPFDEVMSQYVSGAKRGPVTHAYSVV